MAFVLPSYLFATKDSFRMAKDHQYVVSSNPSTPNSDFLRLNNDETTNFEKMISKIRKTNYSSPTEWGESVSGVIDRIPTNENVIALTFDACGGEWGSGYDQELIDYLVTENIPATLFINSRWIDANLEEFLYLASLEQFQIENHGTEHRPLSVTGQTAWGIKGTTSVEEVLSEVTTNHLKIIELTGHTPKYFRSGTAYYDEIAVKIVESLGMKVINFDILGDAGATYSPKQVKEALLKAKSGSIALLHMNQPTKGTAEGVKLAVPLLKEQGFQFVTLDEGFKFSQ